MPTANGDRVPFGQDHLISTGTRSAWGARLIVSQEGYVDFVHDRQGAAGDDRAAFLDLLGERCNLERLTGLIREMLQRGVMQTRTSEDFTVYTDDAIEIHANTNASAGYCYVTAWRKP